MKIVSISQAKVDFLKLIESITRGEKIIITKYGKPKASLIPFKE
jgi:prevent-host-death family protein